MTAEELDAANDRIAAAAQNTETRQSTSVTTCQVGSLPATTSSSGSFRVCPTA